MFTDEISYGGVLSSKFGLRVGTEVHSILPERRRTEVEITGRDGVADFGIGGYATRIITFPVYFEGDYAVLRQNREAIMAWLITRKEPKKLILGSEPDRYYLAKVYAAIDFENTTSQEIGAIQFECNPPWQFLNDGTQLTPEEITWIDCFAAQNQFVKEFNSNGSMRFFNKGTSIIKPVIKIYGNIRSGLTLTCNNQKFVFNADFINDGIAVDCEKESVKLLSNSTNVYEFISDDSDFITLPSGKCEICVTQNHLSDWDKSITVIVEFIPMIGGDDNE